MSRTATLLTGHGKIYGIRRAQGITASSPNSAKARSISSHIARMSGDQILGGDNTQFRFSIKSPFLGRPQIQRRAKVSLSSGRVMQTWPVPCHVLHPRSRLRSRSQLNHDQRDQPSSLHRRREPSLRHGRQGMSHRDITHPLSQASPVHPLSQADTILDPRREPSLRDGRQGMSHQDITHPLSQASPVHPLPQANTTPDPRRGSMGKAFPRVPPLIRLQTQFPTAPDP
jgi:hypothetical protein